MLLSIVAQIFVFCLIDNDHLVLQINECFLLAFSFNNYECKNINVIIWIDQHKMFFDYSWTYIDYTNLPCLDVKEHGVWM